MKIGIDARMYGPKVGGGGLGRYTQMLVKELQNIDHKNRYLLFLKKENFDSCQIKNDLFKKKEIDIHWYTLKEQLFLGPKIGKKKLDLIHFTHWNVPINLKTPFIVTIHDLILLEEPKSAKVSTRHPIIFNIKYWAYKKVLKNALKQSKHIITPSNHTKRSITKFFPEILEEKISVINEGIITPVHPCSPLFTPVHPYFLYVGNAYPHKNLNFLINTFSEFRKAHPEIELVLAGQKNIFYEQLPKTDGIRYVFNPTDQDLTELYQQASLFIFPSKTEGFGLPPLEAMSHGLSVASSSGGSLPEILGQAALYFKPDDQEKLLEIMNQILNNENLKENLIQKGKEQTQKYSWKKMAREIIQVYEKFEQQN